MAPHLMHVGRTVVVSLTILPLIEIAVSMDYLLLLCLGLSWLLATINPSNP
ncbi:hypothetical protein HGA64_05385 [Candidatus Falkowbacteria bacterium]|nr:hypothetical protein [Candidatus Falkowbacteria bacterium]